MPSRFYGALQRNVAELERQFLAFGKRQDGGYTSNELYQCRAYIAFYHSEVEFYLESLALNIISKAEKKWKTKGSVTNAIAAMIAYRAAKEISLPDCPASQSPKKQFSAIVQNAIAAQKIAVSRNHGIGRKNLAELFIPIGMRPSQFDEPLLIQLDALGQRRGDHVHQGSKVSLPKVRDPFDDERSDIQFLLIELIGFDETVAKMRWDCQDFRVWAGG